MPLSPGLKCHVHLGHREQTNRTARENGKVLRKIIPVLVIILTIKYLHPASNKT